MRQSSSRAARRRTSAPGLLRNGSSARASSACRSLRRSGSGRASSSFRALAVAPTTYRLIEVRPERLDRHDRFFAQPPQVLLEERLGRLLVHEVVQDVVVARPAGLVPPQAREGLWPDRDGSELAHDSHYSHDPLSLTSGQASGRRRRARASRLSGGRADVGSATHPALDLLGRARTVLPCFFVEFVEPGATFDGSAVRVKFTLDGTHRGADLGRGHGPHVADPGDLALHTVACGPR